MADRYEDERGVIQDLLDQVDAVTVITTKAGAVRGNHVHEFTDQWVYVVEGRMRTVLRSQGGCITSYIRQPGEFFHEPPGLPHAWRAIEDTTVLVFTRGPRSGEKFESDTRRLAEEDRLL